MEGAFTNLGGVLVGMVWVCDVDLLLKVRIDARHPHP